MLWWLSGYLNRSYAICTLPVQRKISVTESAVDKLLTNKQVLRLMIFCYGRVAMPQEVWNNIVKATPRSLHPPKFINLITQ